MYLGIHQGAYPPEGSDTIIYDRACGQAHNSRSFLYMRTMVEVTQDPARWMIADTRVCCIQISARNFEKEDLR